MSNGKVNQMRFEVDIQYVDIEKIHVPVSTYQRDPNKDSRVAKMDKYFDPDLVDPIAVIPRKFRNYEFEAFDGGARLRKLKALGYTEVPCRIMKGDSTSKQAALLFAKQDAAATGVQTFDQHRALLFGGDKEALCVERDVTASGYILSSDKNRSNPNKIGAINWLYAQNSATRIKVLNFTKKVWPDYTLVTNKPFLDAIKLFLDEYGTKLTDETIENLTKTHPETIDIESRYERDIKTRMRQRASVIRRKSGIRKKQKAKF